MTEPKTIQDITESVADYFGFAASVKIQAGDEIFEIPNPGLLDDDQMERWEELQFQVERCDLDDDGAPIKPYRIEGELLKPSYNVRVAQVLFGDRYEAFKAAGGSGNQVGLIWAQMNDEFGSKSLADELIATTGDQASLS